MGRGGADVDDDDGWWQRSHQAMVETAAGRQWLLSPKLDVSLSPTDADLGTVLCEEASEDEEASGGGDDGDDDDDDWAPAPYDELKPARATKKRAAPAPREGRAERRFGGRPNPGVARRVVRVTVFPESARRYARAWLERDDGSEADVPAELDAPLRLVVACACSDERFLGSRRFWVVADVARVIVTSNGFFARTRTAEEASLGLWCRARFASRETCALVADVEDLSCEATPWIPEAVRRTFEFPLPTIANAFEDVPFVRPVFMEDGRNALGGGADLAAFHTVATLRSKSVRRWPTSKAPLSVGFRSFWLMFRRVIISRNGLEA